MKKEKVMESASIILAVISVYIIENTFISIYSSYLLAILIVFFAIYISIKKRSKSASELFTGSSLEIYGIISVTLLIILITGSLNSPLFFFLYFILFLLAFMCSSLSVWIFVASVILFFVPSASNNLNSDTIIKIASLLLIAPISYFVAKELERRQIIARRIDAKTDDIIADAQAIKENSASTDPAETEMIDEIIEEAESLKQESNS